MDHFHEATMKRIQAVTHTRTQVELAQVLEIQQSSVSDAKRRQTIPAEWYVKLLEKLGVNPDWLKNGMGPIYLRTEEGYVPGDGAGTPVDPALLGTPLARPVLATVYAMHGIMGDEPDVSRLQPLGKIALPATYARQGIIVLEVDTMAAEPFVRKGAHVGIDSRTRYPASGELFAVCVPREGLILRRLFWEQEAGNVVLRAENAACPEIRMQAAECAARLLGRLAWIMQEV